MKGPKFEMNDFVLINFEFAHKQIREPWVGQVEGIVNDTYYMKCLSDDYASSTRIPFLFDKMMVKIKKKNVDKTIKAIRILYGKNTIS